MGNHYKELLWQVMVEAARNDVAMKEMEERVMVKLEARLAEYKEP